MGMLIYSKKQKYNSVIWDGKYTFQTCGYFCERNMSLERHM